MKFSNSQCLFLQGLDEENAYGWPFWVEAISKFSHVMIVFNSSVNYYVYWLKDMLMKKNLTKINTIEKTGDTEANTECVSLVKVGDKQ